MSKNLPPSEYPRYFTNAELRVTEGADKRPRIEGYAAVFNTPSEDLGGFKEVVAPGAFSDVLAANEEVLALVGHDPHAILGRRSSGTLTLAQDERGLRVSIDPPNTTVGNDAVENVRRGDFKGMSFRFPRGAKDSWRREGGDSIRTLHKVGLLEVTLTSIPAYPNTSVSLRQLPGFDDAELRSYYGQQIDALNPKPEPVKLKMAERRLRLLTAGGARAMMQTDDKSLIYCCRNAVQYVRQAFDNLQMVVDCVGAVTGSLTDADQVAVNDCVGEVIDLIAKARLARAALEGVGAEDDAEAESPAA